MKFLHRKISFIMNESFYYFFFVEKYKIFIYPSNTKKFVKHKKTFKITDPALLRFTLLRVMIMRVFEMRITIMRVTNFRPVVRISSRMNTTERRNEFEKEPI